MAKHIVCCRECKQKFDAQNEDKDKVWIMPSKNWYYHLDCYNTWVQKRKDSTDITVQKNDEEYREDIFDYLSRRLKVPFDGGVVGSQIKNMQKKGRKLKGILFALYYYYDIKGNKWNPQYEGIWIAELVYDESRTYWSERAEVQSDILEKIEAQIRSYRELPKIKVKKDTTPKWKSKIDVIGDLTIDGEE